MLDVETLSSRTEAERVGMNLQDAAKLYGRLDALLLR